MDDRRLKQFLANLAPESATQAAEDCGADVTRLARDMMLTPPQAVLKVQEFSNALMEVNKPQEPGL